MNVINTVIDVVRCAGRILAVQRAKARTFVPLNTQAVNSFRFAFYCAAACQPKLLQKLNENLVGIHF